MTTPRMRSIETIQYRISIFLFQSPIQQEYTEHFPSLSLNNPPPKHIHNIHAHKSLHDDPDCGSLRCYDTYPGTLHSNTVDHHCNPLMLHINPLHIGHRHSSCHHHNRYCSCIEKEHILK